MKKACCGFGHRRIFNIIDKKLEKLIKYAIEQGCEIFYTGDMGDFDSKFSAAVKSAQNLNPGIKLICVKPYLTKELNQNKEYYYFMYDDIIIPTEIADFSYKTIIKKRNEWMINHSHIVITYTLKNYGGAYTALKYAKKNNKIVKELK